jgi:hypothetical protein
VVGEGFGRREGESPNGSLALDLLPGQVAAGWWGARFDLRSNLPGPPVSGVRAALVRGWVDVSDRGRYRSDSEWLSIRGSRPQREGAFEADLSLANFRLEDPEGTWGFVHPDLRVVRTYPTGITVGGRLAFYRKQGLLLPVLGYERRLGDQVTLWAASEPGLELTAFRETFVTRGDWNVPDFALPAVRRAIDVRGGLRWSPHRALETSLRAEWFRAGHYRTWRREGGLWVESAIDHASGPRLAAEGTWNAAPALAVSLDLTRQWIRSSGEPVPFTPSREGRLRVDYRMGSWTVSGSVLGVGGRRDEEGTPFGTYLRWDGELVHRAGGGLEYALRIENLGNSSDRRWPGFPASGRGIFGGVRYILGS